MKDSESAATTVELETFLEKKEGISGSENSENSSGNHGIRRKGDDTISSSLTLVNFLRGMIGPGCFSIPLALKFAGLWTGISLIFIMGFIAYVNMAKLVRCSQYLSTKCGVTALNYGNVSEAAFKHGHHKLRPHAQHAKLFVNGCLLVLQLGVCAVCYIFMVSHLKEVLDVLFPAWALSQRQLLLFSLPFFCLLVSVRSFKVLSLISVVGNTFMIIALGIILRELIGQKSLIHQLPSFTNFDGVLMAAASILYSFEGVAIVLPLENRLRNPKDFNGVTGVLSVGMSLTTLTYALCGFFGYIGYGESVRGSITLNLSDTPLIFVVKILLTSITFLGFLMQHFVLIEMYLPELITKLNERKWKSTGIALVEYANRYVVVILTFILCILIPHLSDIIPLIGATMGTLLAVIIPPILEMVVFSSRSSPKKSSMISFNFITNILLIITGVVMIILSLKSNITHLTG